MTAIKFNLGLNGWYFSLQRFERKCVFWTENICPIELWRKVLREKIQWKSNSFSSWELKITGKKVKYIQIIFNFLFVQAVRLNTPNEHWKTIFFAISFSACAASHSRCLKIMIIWNGKEFIFALIYVYHNFFSRPRIRLRFYARVFLTKLNSTQHLVCVRQTQCFFLSCFGFGKIELATLVFFIWNCSH